MYTRLSPQLTERGWIFTVAGGKLHILVKPIDIFQLSRIIAMIPWGLLGNQLYRVTISRPGCHGSQRIDNVVPSSAGDFLDTTSTQCDSQELQYEITDP